MNSRAFDHLIERLRSVAAGRARWKIQNAHHNALKNRSHHLEHNFGHGKQPLASLLLRMNLLALGLHTVLDWADENYRRIRATGARGGGALSIWRR